MSETRVVHVGLGQIGLAIARRTAERDGLRSVAAVDPALAGRTLAELCGERTSTCGTGSPH
ncbi:MAG: hypothetical protein D6815_04975, partial [Candidatus Dadabacteria bacterium]